MIKLVPEWISGKQAALEVREAAANAIEHIDHLKRRSSNEKRLF